MPDSDKTDQAEDTTDDARDTTDQTRDTTDDARDTTDDTRDTSDDTRDTSDDTKDDKAQKDKGKDHAEEVKLEDLKFDDTHKIDDDIRSEFMGIVNSKDLSQKDRAQALIDLQQKIYTKQVDNHREQVKQWEKEVKNDKDIGGDKLDENLSIAKKALDDLKIEGLADLLDASGLGSHPIIIKMFHKIGSSISDDTLIMGSKGRDEPKKKDLAEILYGS